ncbi:MAG: hypothetical protein GY832_10405 [Chloroflexi bacterium]|nr:hypothetical protein [Chloroflexota bacterium]
MTLELLDIIGLAVGALLTIMILSYLLGDNPLYRLALHIFVGALVGYSFGIILLKVIYELVIDPLLSPQSSIGMFALLLILLMSLLLLFKILPRTAYISNLSVAYLVGVGTAVALGGALLGTLVPQIRATGQTLSAPTLVGFGNGLLILAGTIFSLMAFNFTAQEQVGLAGIWGKIVKILGGVVGRGFLIVAFGVAFAGALTTSLSIFIGRIQYIIEALEKIIPGN